MESKTSDRLTQFAANWQVIRKDFKMHSPLTKRLAALMYAQESKPIDNESIRQCHALIKENTGAFSTFRGNMSLCIATLLSLSADPRRQFSDTLKVYDLLKDMKFHASDFLVIAAYEIASQAKPENFQNVVSRAREFFDGMKARRFFSTGQDDYIFTAMLGLSDIDVTAGTERVEQVFSRLKGSFTNRNSVQALSQILVLSGSCDETVERVLYLRDTLRSQGIKLYKAYTLPTLGVLALLPVECAAIVRDINEAQQMLQTQKGFGALSVSKQELLLYASAIAAGEYAENLESGVLTATLGTSIANIIIAQQVAMIAAILASATAATAAST